MESLIRQVRTAFVREHWAKSAFFLGVVLFLAALLCAALTKNPKFGLAVVIALIGGLSILRWPTLGVGVLTFLLPLERMQRFTDDNSSFTISIMRFVALATLGVIMLRRVIQKKPILLDYSMLLYGGYTLIAISGLFYSTDLMGTKRAVGTIGANVIFIFIYLNYFSNRRQVRLMLFIWLASNVLAITYSAYDWHFGSGSGGGVETEFDPGKGAQVTENRWSTVWQDRAEFESLGGVVMRRSMGPTSHAAVYGINLIMTMPFFVLLLGFCRNNIWRLAGGYAMLGLLAYNLLLTNTRAVFLQAGLTAVFCVLAGLYRIRTYHIFIALVAGSLFLSVVPQDVYKRILDPSNYSLENSGAMRVRISYWKAGFRILEDKWLVGMGVGNEKEIPKNVIGQSAENSTVHNTFLQFLLEVGIVGWLLFYGFVATMFFYAHRASRYFLKKPGWEFDGKLLVGIQVAFVSVLIFGLQVDVFLFPLKGWWLLAMIAVVYYRWSVLERKQLQSEGQLV